MILPAAIHELNRLAPSLDEMLSVLSACVDCPREVLEGELQSHLAARAFFLLLEDIELGHNFDNACKRVASRLKVEPREVEVLVRRLAEAHGHLRSSETEARATIESVAYYERKRLLALQGERCAYCGWSFVQDDGPSRAQEDTLQTLDHRVVYRLGGNARDNLVIACSLCNRLKGAAVHIGERGSLWIDNWTIARNERLVAFWRLARDGGCTVGECKNGPSKMRMCVSRMDGSFISAVDSVRTVCLEHARQQHCLPY